MEKNKNESKNEGIHMSGGKIEANNLAVGEGAKIEIHSEQTNEQKKDSETPDLKTDLKKKIGENKPEQVINELLRFMEKSDDEESINLLYLQLGKIQHFKSQKQAGIISIEDVEMFRSRINSSILELIDKCM